MARQNTASTIEISLDAVTRTLASRISLYRWRRPVYHTALLGSLSRIWNSAHRTVLDVGGGTGIMAQSIKTLFPVDRVVSIDVQDRYLAGLDIEKHIYNGRTLPFADSSFDCALLFNVLHHVPRDIRISFLKECGRVAGTLYIKDHVAQSPLDHLRLAMLDLIGNVPFGGMIQASYLGLAEWEVLAKQAGLQIEDWQYDRYRRGPMRWIFPNQLEVLMKWTVVRE